MHHSTFLPALSPALLLSFGHIWVPSPYSWIVESSTQHSRWGHANAEYSGVITSFDQLVMLCLVHHQEGVCPPYCQSTLLIYVKPVAKQHTPDPFLQGCSPATSSPSAGCYSTEMFSCERSSETELKYKAPYEHGLRTFNLKNQLSFHGPLRSGHEK